MTQSKKNKRKNLEKSHFDVLVSCMCQVYIDTELVTANNCNVLNLNLMVNILVYYEKRCSAETYLLAYINESILLYYLRLKLFFLGDNLFFNT